MRRNRWPQYLFGMILVVFVATVAVRAQTPSPTPSLEHEFFKNILRDQKVIWTAPLHLQRHDAKWVIPGSVGFMALITTDRMTGDEIFESNRQLKASQVISQFGSVYTLGAASATLYFIGRDKKNARARETGLLSAEAMVDSLIVGGALKGITQRARPLDGHERSEFFDGGSSFPSGHSTQAWAFATVIANEYQHRRLVQILAYGMAGAVSVARFTEHKHYLSDVLAGSALGYGIGKYVYHAHHQQSLDSSDDAGPLSQSWVPKFTPQFNPHARAYGVNLRWSF